MVRAQVQLTERQVEVLKRRAHRDKVSFAELIRRAVDLFCLQERELPTEDRRRRALALMGRHGSGDSRGSADHDRILAEAYLK
jgi:hypothetical protein